MLSTNLRIVSVNAGGRCRGIDAIDAIIAKIDECTASWAAVYVSELDHTLNSFSVTEVTYSGHKIYRHWPGEGSFAMAWIVNKNMTNFLKRITWSGRAGGIWLQSQDPRQHGALNMQILGIHGGHAEALGSSLYDGSLAWPGPPRGCRRLAVGDWNVDQLPVCADDPLADSHDRSLRHLVERIQLHSWADAQKLQIALPDIIHGTPGGMHDSFSLAPISRVPLGQQDSNPSLVDYAHCSNDTISNMQLNWDIAISDHAGLVIECITSPIYDAIQKTHWKPICECIAVEWIRDNHHTYHRT